MIEILNPFEIQTENMNSNKNNLYIYKKQLLIAHYIIQ